MKCFHNLGLLAGVLLCATVALLWAGTTAQVMYIPTPLMLVSNGEYSGVSVLNNQGQAAGWADTGPTDNIRHPFLYTGGSMIDLTPSNSASLANAINDCGRTS